MPIPYQFDTESLARAILGGGALGLRAVDIQDQRHAQDAGLAQRAHEADMGFQIDRGNLDARNAEQAFRARAYDDERSDLSSQRNADTTLFGAMNGGEFGQTIDLPGEMGPYPEEIAARRQAIDSALAASSPAAKNAYLRAAMEQRAVDAQDQDRTQVLLWAEQNWRKKMTPTQWANVSNQILTSKRPQDIQARIGQRDSVRDMLMMDGRSSEYAEHLADILAYSDPSEQNELIGAYDKLDKRWEASKAAAAELAAQQAEFADSSVRLERSGGFDKQRAEDFVHLRDRGLVNQAPMNATGRTQADFGGVHKALARRLKGVQERIDLLEKDGDVAMYAGDSTTPSPAFRKYRELQKQRDAINAAADALDLDSNDAPAMAILKPEAAPPSSGSIAPAVPAAPTAPAAQGTPTQDEVNEAVQAVGRDRAKVEEYIRRKRGG